MGWHGVANMTHEEQDASFFSTPGNCFASLLFLYLLTNERSSEILDFGKFVTY